MRQRFWLNALQQKEVQGHAFRQLNLIDGCARSALNTVINRQILLGVSWGQYKWYSCH